ncbi:SMI1/KNR4 family protein [Streptomyces sp. NRRL F-2580]|uniref:SMI1/KNR4 family protein n=1 Tax=Streptomyces sp. NRRL F-2580 TaxID=1463841 RepID=UPI001F21EDE8|nr:SMI1/KNR4 family protein [Streptomyces sp. NRRL F-2580]
MLIIYSRGDSAMGIHPDVATLLDLVPPDFAGGERIDWDAAEAALGTKLPSDYKALLDTYGVGDIGELVILPPLPSDVRGYERCHVGSMTAGLRGLWDDDSGVPGVTLGADAVLPWGSGMNANEMAWLMNDPDPDKWPVVAWRRHHLWSESPWALFDCGMVQFITRMMLGQFEACPLGDASLWTQTDTFVSWREQRRRELAGLDPQTGEPNPYASMYPVTDD